MVQNGELPMVGRWMFDLKDLDEWIMRNKRRL
jgi:Helix-turn-helix domain